MTPSFRTTALSAVVVSGLLLTSTPALADEAETSSAAISSSASSTADSSTPATTEPATELPVESPASEESAADVPVADVSTPEAPASESPVSDVPGTEAPASEAPSSESAAGEQSADATLSNETEAPTAPGTSEDPTTTIPATVPAEASGVVVFEVPPTPADNKTETAEEPPAHEWARDFFAAHSEIETPRGSEEWSSDDWADFLDSPESEEFQSAFFGAFMDSDEAAYVDDLTFFFVETNDEEYIYEMFDFLSASFPNHPGLAEGLFYVVINMLVEAGYLEWEDGAEFPTVPEAPAPSEKPETPKNPEPGQVPVVKPAPSGGAAGSQGGVKSPVTVVPAGTISQPETIAQPQAQEELAQTGASSALLFGGLGALLAALGALFVGMRRRLG